MSWGSLPVVRPPGATFSCVGLGRETRDRRRCSVRRAYSCGACPGVCGSLDSVGFPWGSYLFRAAGGKEGEKVPLPQAADDGRRCRCAQGKTAQRKRAERAVFQDGKRPAGNAVRAVAEEI